MNWSDLRKSKVEDVCKYVAEMYLKEEKLSIVAKKLCVHDSTMVTFMNSNEAEFKKAYPAIHKAYVEKKEKVRLDKYNKNGTAWKNGIKFDIKKFEELPKQVKYKDFINFLLNFNTGSKSIDHLIGLAAKKGIKVVG